MKRQLSNNQTRLVQALLVCIGTGLPCLIITFFIFVDNNFSIIESVLISAFCVLLGLSILYFSIQLQKVVFDKDFVYASCLGKIKKISIDKIDQIKSNPIPFRVFYSNTYFVTLTYIDNQSRSKIQFLSKGATGMVGTVDHIPLLGTLRQLIKDKKQCR